MTWWQYVQEVSGGDSQVEIARRIHLSGPSVSRWQTNEPKPANAVAFARAYGRPVLEAFVAAGFLTADDAKQRPVGRVDLSKPELDELLAEIARRFKEVETRQGRDTVLKFEHKGRLPDEAESPTDYSHLAADAGEDGISPDQLPEEP